MQTQELTIKRREGTGKQVAKRLRRNGVVPAVLYGGAKPETVAVDPRAVLRIIHGHEGSTQLLTLKFEGDAGSRMAIIRDLQFDPVSENLLHVDLQEVTADRAISVRVADVPCSVHAEIGGIRELVAPGPFMPEQGGAGQVIEAVARRKGASQTGDATIT